MATTKLDLTGLKCPLPALKTRKALKTLTPGAFVVLELVAEANLITKYICHSTGGQPASACQP